MKKILTRARNDAGIRKITKDESAYLILRMKIMNELFPGKDSRIFVSRIPRKWGVDDEIFCTEWKRLYY